MMYHVYLVIWRNISTLKRSILEIICSLVAYKISANFHVTAILIESLFEGIGEGVIDRQNATWNIIDFIKIRFVVSFLNNKE